MSLALRSCTRRWQESLGQLRAIQAELRSGREPREPWVTNALLTSKSHVFCRAHQALLSTVLLRKLRQDGGMHAGR